MTTRLCGILLFLLLTLLMAPACSPRSGSGDGGVIPGDSVTAFVNLNVVTMRDERVLENHTVVVQDDRIVAVGPAASVDIPSGAGRIEGDGRYLLPGLADLHVHLRSTDELLSYLAHGVTTVVHVSGAMSGAPDILRYRSELASGARIGPSLFATGSILDGDPPIFAGVSTVVTNAEEARRAVAGQHEAGYDLIKVYNNLPPDALRAAVDEAHAHGMAVIGHVPRLPSRAQALQGALEAGMDVIAHGEEYFFTYLYAGVDSLLDRGEIPYRSDARIAEAVEMTKRAGTAVMPNLSFVAMTRRQLDDFGDVFTDPEARYLHSDVAEMWAEQNPTTRPDLERFDRRERAKYAFLQRLTKALSDAGITLLLGTDASAPGMYPGASAHLELREFVAAGLTPYDALAAGTRDAGAFLEEHVPGAPPSGLVAPGYRADLILVRGNPLADIGHASMSDGVMVRGRWFSRTQLDLMRDETAATYGR